MANHGGCDPESRRTFCDGDMGRLELLRPSPIPGGPTQSFIFDYLTVLKEGGFAPNPSDL